MANEFIARNGIIALNNSQITGSLNVSNGITGSLLGTASYAATASYALNALGANVNTSSFLITASASNTTITFTKGDGTTFDVTVSQSGSVATASYAVFAQTAATASYATNFIVSGSISDIDYINFQTGSDQPQTQGRLGWDDGYGTLNLGLKGGNVNLAIGQEMVARVYNADTVPLVDGMIVYISGSQGNRISVKRASATAELGSANTLGMVTEPIPTGSEGFITTQGVVNGLNTIGLTAGALIYLSSSAGQYTQIRPTAPNHTVVLGYVERVHATIGSIYIKVDNGYEIGELHDVVDNTTTSSYGDLLVKSGSVWINSKQLTGSYSLTGSLQATSFTGSLQGTSSYATTASYANVAQTLLGSVVSSSYASTASYAQNSAASTINITQTSHGFTIPSYGFIPVYKSGSGNWFTASSVSIDKTQVAFVVGVTDASNFTLQENGFFTTSSHGLTTSSYYYLQDNGSISTTPDNQIQSAVCYVIDSTRMILLNDPAYNTTITASYASSSISSSYAATASIATSASYANVAQTLLGSVVSASYAATASLATTASYALNGGVSNTINITQTSHGFTLPSYGFIPVYKSGSSNFATASTININQTQVGFVVGVVDSSNFTLQENGFFTKTSHGLTTSSYYFLQDNGSISTTPDVQIQSAVCFVIDENRVILLNDPAYDTTVTSSWAQNSVTSSYALVAQTLLGSVVSASYAATSSYVLNAVSASYIQTAQTASYVLNAVSASFATSASRAVTASYADVAQTLLGSVVSASYAATASIATSASYALSASWAPGGTTTAPGGSNRAIQFNDTGTFSGSANFSFNKTSNIVSLTGSMYISSSNNIILNIDTTVPNTLFISSSGRTGLGTNDPQSLFHLKTNVAQQLFRLENTVTNNYTTFAFQGTGRSYYVGVGNNAETFFGVADKYHIYDANANAIRFVIDTAGSVGLGGVTSPTATLDVTGNAKFSTGITASLQGTASYATQALSASWAPGGSGGLKTKAGSVANTSFTGTPEKATVTFSTAFPDTNYAVTVTGEDARSWTIESKLVGSFVINSNSSQNITGTTYWIATAFGETT